MHARPKKHSLSCPHCGKPAIVTSRNTITPQFHDLYCQCLNTADCGASFVFKLSYSHDLNPPQKTTRQIAIELIKCMPADERRGLLQADLFV
jgi:hypothetical protein